MCAASKAICRPFQKTQNRASVNNRRVDRMSARPRKVRSHGPHHGPRGRNVQVFSEIFLAGGNPEQKCVCVVGHGHAFWLTLFRGDCFPQSLGANPIRRRAQHGGPAPVMSEVRPPEREADRNVFVWKAQLGWLLPGKCWNEGPVLMGRWLEFSCGLERCISSSDSHDGE